MRRCSFFTALVLYVAFYAAGAHAQQTTTEPPKSVMPKMRPHFETPLIDPQQKSFMADPLYKSMAQTAVKKPPEFDFSNFRYVYAETSQYDPLGDTAREWLLKLSYIARTEKDAKKRDKAFLDFGGILSNHLANLDVINQALVLSQEDRRFGDPAFFEWLRYGLVEAVTKSGDGSSIFRAYNVVTIGEESALLRQLNVRVVDTKSEESGGTYYNMHMVNDGIHPPYTIFVDLSVPMRFLESRRPRNEFAVPRQ